MWWMKCIAVVIVSAILQTNADPTDTIPPQTDTTLPPTDVDGPLPVLPPVQPTQEQQIPINAGPRYRSPIRTGGKPVATALPSIVQDENYIDENTDLSSGDIPNFVFVPILSQSFYFPPERSYPPPSLRNFFAGDRSTYGVVQDPFHRNVDNALYDTYFTRQNQDGAGSAGMVTFGGGLSIVDRFNAFREWLLNLFPFRIEFVRPTNQGGRPMLLGVPQNNFPSTINHVPTSVNNIPNTGNYVPSNFPPTTNNKLSNFPSTLNNAPSNFPATTNNAPNTGINVPNAINNIPNTFPTTVNKIPTTTNNFQVLSDNVQNTANNVPAGIYRQKYVPNDPFNRGFYNFQQNEYLQPNRDITNRNYQPMLNNYRDIPRVQPYAYRQYPTPNVYPYGQTSGMSKVFNPSSND